MLWPPAWLRQLAQDSWHQPLSRPVPADAGFAARKGIASLAARSLRRRMQLRLSGQRQLRVDRLLPGWTRLLWLHEGMPQIGDALMDLAPRSLLVASGRHVDLLAPPHLAGLFAGDAWFRRVMTADGSPLAQDYDAVILLSDDRRSLRLKCQRLPGLPWLSLHGLYNGPDFHRGLFSAQRHADWLGRHLSTDMLAGHARQKLAIQPAAASWAQQQQVPADGLVLALGGVAADRSYQHWPELVAALRAKGHRTWVLVGSDNGRSAADAVLATAQADDQMLDWVGRTRLPQVQALIAQSRAVICCDGGLMHLALTTETPVLGLFNAAIDPAWRLPGDARCAGLRSPGGDVSSLQPDRVAQRLGDLLASAERGGS